METELEQLIAGQDLYFKNAHPIPINERKRLLKFLSNVIKKKQGAIVDAIYKDFKKPGFEVLLTEVQLVLKELKQTLTKIDRWTTPKKVPPNLLNFPSSAKIYREAYGRVLIISPWNYPFSLAMTPLIGAIAAGNTVVLKPSELSPHTSELLKEIVEAVFPPLHVVVLLGDEQIAKQLLELRWDYIFFTGSPKVGSYVYQKAAIHLTPVTLELGGKSPCIVDEKANLEITAKRIVWGKFLNAGQSCIAPDYILADHKIKEGLVDALKKAIIQLYSENPIESDSYAHLINTAHAYRLQSTLLGQKILFGGLSKDSFMSPTLVDEPSLESPLMTQEIFGPILPIISFETFQEMEEIIGRYEKPLALYVFSENEGFTKKVLKKISFGGGVVNDTMVHYINNGLPFGGVGQSGIGAYHGAFTFETFTHQKPVVTRGSWVDIPLRYPPYLFKVKWLKFLQKLI